MPQIQIGSSNINSFGFSATLDVLQRSLTFNLLPFTTGAGLANTKVAFSVVDQAGIILAGIDFAAPQIPNPATTTSWVLDLSDTPFEFLFQAYNISASIQDQNGTVYNIPPIITNICQPNDLQNSGYVCGVFQLIIDCVNNALTVKELSLLIYNSLKPTSVVKTGTLFYPTGTLAQINFSNTPFTNNQIYTGQYRISCTTVATYSIGQDIYVAVSYVTDQAFDGTCSNRIADLLCCIRGVQETKEKNCGNAKGDQAAQLLKEIQIPFFMGITAEFNGQDSSREYQFIKKTLDCSCGNGSLGQNEVTPVNPSVYSIVLGGVGGTSVNPPVVTGNTKTFQIQSNIYQVTKGVPSDPGFTIGLDNSTPNNTKYPITFNYLAMAQAIYTATANDPGTLAQLNALMSSFGLDLSGLNGSCVINLTQANYTILQNVTNSTGISSITINGVIYMAPSGLLATNVSGVATWLNSLTLGSFTATLNSGILQIQTINNTNSVATITFTNPNTVIAFSATSATLVQILQAIINYLCNLTALQMELGDNLSTPTFDYNGNIVTTQYISSDTQDDFNAAVSASLNSLALRISSVTGITCAKIQSLFPANPSAVFNPGTDSFLATIAGSCTSISAKQAVLAILASVNADSTVKAAWCAINCSTPATCPDVAGINLSIISGNIGVYGVTWSQNPTANQTVAVKYRISGTSTWTIATNALLLYPNGNIAGTSPYQISGLVPGRSYDVQVINNCGGAGFISSITVPSSAVFNTNVLLSSHTYSICGGGPVTVYSSQSFGVGTQLFYDAGLTTPVTGFLFVSPTNTQEIFQLSGTSGIVGADTGTSCNSGTSGTYLLGNSIGGVCGGVPTTLYTNGAFVTGGIIYTDAALTMPVTGYTYISNSANNHIYSLNSSTGFIGADTGTVCTGTATLTFKFVNAGGSFLNMQASLSRAIDGNIAISKYFSDGFSDAGCTTAVASAQKNSTMNITPGATAVGSNPDSTTGSWASAIRSSVYNIIVNGTPVVNGSTLTVGSFVVTCSIPSCES